MTTEQQTSACHHLLRSTAGEREACKACVSMTRHINHNPVRSASPAHPHAGQHLTKQESLPSYFPTSVHISVLYYLLTTNLSFFTQDSRSCRIQTHFYFLLFWVFLFDPFLFSSPTTCSRSVRLKDLWNTPNCCLLSSFKISWS